MTFPLRLSARSWSARRSVRKGSELAAAGSTSARRSRTTSGTGLSERLGEDVRRAQPEPRGRVELERRHDGQHGAPGQILERLGAADAVADRLDSERESAVED